jgi:hypothetical protein
MKVKDIDAWEKFINKYEAHLGYKVSDSEYMLARLAFMAARSNNENI